MWIKIADKLINVNNVNTIELHEPDQGDADWWLVITFNGGTNQKHVRIAGGSNPEQAAYDILKLFVKTLNATTITRPMKIEQSELAHN
tara:strand:+ start:3004 stop:3267 length:264 start_codon:yes stop_codon:yes gene_type:complete